MDNLKIPELSQGKNNTSGEIYVNNDGSLPVEGQNQLTVLEENLRDGIFIKQWLSDIVRNSQINVGSYKYLTSLGRSILTTSGFRSITRSAGPANYIKNHVESINLQSIDYAINKIEEGYDYASAMYDVVSNDTIVYPNDDIGSGVIFYRYRSIDDTIYTGKISFNLATEFDKLKIRVNSSIHLYLIHYVRSSDHYLKILTPQGGDVMITRVSLYKDHEWEDRGNVMLTEQYQMTLCDEEGVPIILE